MILIVGLGNPGRDYANTPHNMGFRVLDFFRERYLPRKEWHTKFSSATVEAELQGKQITLQKPLTFMNNSGVAVKNAMDALGVKSGKSLWVVHDELDLPWGKVKVDVARNAAGHKGVESIIDALESSEFWRFRVGIRPDIFPEFRADVDRYLTNEDIPPTHLAWDELLQEKVSELIHAFLTEGIKRERFLFTL